MCVPLYTHTQDDADEKTRKEQQAAVMAITL